jgi:hypothetical protein
MLEDVQVGVEEGDRAAVRQAGSFEEVAGTGTDVEVPVAEVPPVPLHEASRGHRHTTGVKKPRIRRS